MKTYCISKTVEVKTFTGLSQTVTLTKYMKRLFSIGPFGFWWSRTLIEDSYPDLNGYETKYRFSYRAKIQSFNELISAFKMLENDEAREAFCKNEGLTLAIY